MRIRADIEGVGVLSIDSLARLQNALDAQTQRHRTLLQRCRARGVSVPTVYGSGVRYEREPIGQEQWQTIGSMLRSGGADCEDLATWRAAELQEAGTAARAVCARINSGLVHVYVRHPDGRREDPSYRLGMGSETGKVSGWR